MLLSTWTDWLFASPSAPARPRGTRARRRDAAADVEMLEQRTLLSGTTITVTNTNDGGGGSLRAAIAQANTNDADTIKFASNLSGTTIHLTSGELDIG